MACVWISGSAGCSSTKDASQCATDGGGKHPDASQAGSAAGHLAVIGAAGTSGANGSSGKGGGGAGFAGQAGSGGASGAGTDNDAGEAEASLKASNLPASALSQGGVGGGIGDLDLTENGCTIDTDAGTISCVDDKTAFHYSAVDQAASGGARIGVFLANAIRIEASASVRVKGSLPLALVAVHKLEIFGELSAAALKADAFAGGSVTASTGKGGGPGGGGPEISYNAGGGGSFCGKGGTGNAITAGMSGAGGPTYGTPELVPLLAGSAGGCDSSFGGGGGGGGAIQLVAGEAIAIGTSGTVHAGGGGGGGGGNNGCGGGSGGAILIEAPTVQIDGTLAVNGGGGNVYTGGPAGQDGQPSTMPALGGSATAGMGSADATIDGKDGSMTADSNNSSGGGGGGAGRIRINTDSGSATIHGTISPAASTACVSQGKR